MKTDWAEIERYRVNKNLPPEMQTQPGEKFGVFAARFAATNAGLYMIVTAGDPTEPDTGEWEHVSVHAKTAKGQERTPNWAEMCWVKNLFWGPEECVVQYHPPASEYVNHHPHVLHLWRPVNKTIPTPPKICV